MSKTAVLVIDMLNSYQHEDAEKLAPSVEEIVDPVSSLIAVARERDDVDLVYINDNYGDFTATHDDIVRSALDGKRPDLVKPLVPEKDDLFLEKVRHSAFYATPLAHLLRELESERLILTGRSPNSASSTPPSTLYIRHFQVVVPPNESRTSTTNWARRHCA